MIKSVIGERLDRLIHRLFPFLFVRRLNPNLLTVCGVIVSSFAAAAFMSGRVPLGGVLILAGGFFDLVDGVVARHHGISTRFGAFLDSTLDRVVDMALLLGLVLFYAGAGESGHVLLAGYAMAATVLVSYAQAKAEQVVPDFNVGLFERGERIVVLAAGVLSGWVVPALWIIAIGSTVTVAQRFAKAHREMGRMDAAGLDAAGNDADERAALEEPTS